MIRVRAEAGKNIRNAAEGVDKTNTTSGARCHGNVCSECETNNKVDGRKIIIGLL